MFWISCGIQLPKLDKDLNKALEPSPNPFFISLFPYSQIIEEG
jgi:hypothetical protein